ncbi:maleylpyruvate isomerase family mycothiol-dependent enzyme [Streptomyces gibsoniae]|uniref:Maleylpyruvate isomerase family mycothiol-dependent enzyme n=1 Tax=Streptomyces gibsoniae TaxID=3075529 RepID=A0ABU2U5P0_9ACTN|nr:maleylpyruvate isomerase family mycothiol-dependent enzyme [Streptomyces sp. DSM 41699]MDT0468543.1 maleylpyruvate isomerase family mycothiol-dependent enzyme [Streptomyces sp. DSM 41699]
MTATTDLTRANLTALLGSVRDSAARLTDGLGELTDLQAREPSALAGWSRGHVITHVARSADVYRWLLHLARTGIEPGPRADGPALARALREGAGRDAATLVADLHHSMDRLLDEATAMPTGRWSTLVTALVGWRHTAWFTLHRARRELEVHHVDLSLGHTTADWPVDFVVWALDDTVAALTAHGFALGRVEAPDLDRAWSLAPTGQTVTGSGHALLAWLSGRGGDTALRSELPLPTPPAWPLPPAPGWS